MKPTFVDTNIFIRFITKDDSKKAAKCWLLFKKAREKKVILTTSEAILAETVYILTSKALYGLSREEVRDKLQPLIGLKGLKLNFRVEILMALDIFVEYKIDFEDALTVARMKSEQIKNIYSYDQDFDKVDWICRQEP